MFRMQDVIMLVVAFSSIAAGILLPGHGAVFQPYPMTCMMGLLFLSFLSVRLTEIAGILQRTGLTVCFFAAVKLILLPVSTYLPFAYLCPRYALSALLLSAVSTGATAPFFATLVEANGSLVIAMVTLTSLSVPFTLPALVETLAGQSMTISTTAMVRFLSLVVFVPLILSEVMNRVAPAPTRKLIHWRYPLSLVLLAVTMVGVFSKYASFLAEEPWILLLALAVSFVLALVYFLSGLLISRKRPLDQKLSAIISLGTINNVLVMVLSSEFFSPLEATVAAIYSIPFFCFVIPLRMVQNHHEKRAEIHLP